jgi:hypothetical protein
VIRDRVVDLLRSISAGNTTLSLAPGERYWGEVNCGDVRFVADGWSLVLFNDCDDLDYVDSVVTPEGEAFGFDDLLIGISCPLDDLTGDESAALAIIVSQIR